MVPTAGMLLVATPELTDPNFARTVIYLMEHSPQATLGFVINRPHPRPLGDIWSEVPGGLAACRAAAEGGPVEPLKGLLLHGCPELPGVQAMAYGVAVGGDLDALAARYRSGCDATGPRLFLGHSGWTAGQLERELGEGTWILRPGSAEVLLDINPPDDLWQRLLEGRAATLPRPSPN